MNWFPILLATACSSAPPAVEPVLERAIVASRTTFGTMTSMGPFRLDARTSTTTRSESGEKHEDESYSLRWQDESRWQVIRRRDGERTEELRVWDNRAWRAGGNGALLLRGDAEPYRASLAVNWDPWASAIGSWNQSVGFRLEATEQVEGRTALVYSLEPLAGAPSRKGNELVSVEGKVWIDETTAARLVGDVKLVTIRHGREQSVELRFSVTEVGGDPGVEAPPGAVAPSQRSEAPVPPPSDFGGSTP